MKPIYVTVIKKLKKKKKATKKNGFSVIIIKDGIQGNLILILELALYPG